MNPDSPLTCLKGVGPRRAELLGKLGLFSLGALLRFAPRDYRDYSRALAAGEAGHGQDAAFALTILAEPKLARIRRGLSILSAQAADESGKLTLTWYNQPFRKDGLARGQKIIACGRVDRTRGSKLVNPTLFPALPGILPLYPLTRGLSQKQLRDLARAALSTCLPDLVDPLPEPIRAAYGLEPLGDALESLHFPGNMEALARARRRLAFEDMLLFRLMLGLSGQERRAAPARPIDASVETFLPLLPFIPTGAQLQAMADIRADMAAGRAMNRLIQGDVGSGKTAVAFFAMHAAMEAGRQAALMAPTEILARQHYEKLCVLFGPARIRLLLGGMKKSEREEAWEALSTGRAALAVGTHALLRQEGGFHDLALVVTDEQHRFGVSQRAAIAAKGREGVHVLVMSATPIPRTLALLLYGDLDVSRIGELPPGRKPIKTSLVPPSRRRAMYDFLAAQISEGRQAYVVCPLVEESEELPGVPGAVSHCAKLKRAFPSLRIGLLHGQMPAREKEAVAAAFRDGAIDILVSTTVIEVGVDVPNACVMAIEHADRFGLAQLHQLRGRVGRGSAKSYCFLISAAAGDTTATERLRMLVSSQDGFAIAEADLTLRGPGEFLGKRQHGLSEFAAASLAMDMGVLQQAQEAADRLLADPAWAASAQPLLEIARARLAATEREIAPN